MIEGTVFAAHKHTMECNPAITFVCGSDLRRRWYNLYLFSIVVIAGAIEAVVVMDR